MGSSTDNKEYRLGLNTAFALAVKVSSKQRLSENLIFSICTFDFIVVTTHQSTLNETESDGKYNIYEFQNFNPNRRHVNGTQHFLDVFLSIK